LPQRVGLGSAWLLGLLMDLTQGTLIGEQALALTILSFLVILLHGTLQMLTKWQRTAVVLLLVLAYQLILLFIQRIVGKMPFSWFYLLPAFTSALCWPLVSAFLSAMQRRWRLVDTSMRNIYTRL
jgi:rod shape-determining protein MreD